MRSRTVWALVGMLLCAAVVAGCETSASTTTKTISLDAGALVIQPTKAQPVIYGKKAALFNLEHSEPLGSGWAVESIQFGYVTVRPSILRGGEAAGPQHRLAWVLFYNPGAFASAGPFPTCPGGKASSAVQGRKAMIVDALNEASFVYTGTGKATCGTATAPSAKQALQRVSVPWVDLGDGWVRATFPGRVDGGFGTPSEGRSGTPLELVVMGQGFIGPCTAQPRSAKFKLFLPASYLNLPRPWKHGPLGPTYLGGFSTL